jgi:hypothetical protein
VKLIRAAPPWPWPRYSSIVPHSWSLTGVRASPELRRPSSTRPRNTTTTLVPLTVEHPSSTSIPAHEQKNKVENNPEIFIF